MDNKKTKKLKRLNSVKGFFKAPCNVSSNGFFPFSKILLCRTKSNSHTVLLPVFQHRQMEEVIVGVVYYSVFKNRTTKSQIPNKTWFLFICIASNAFYYYHHTIFDICIGCWVLTDVNIQHRAQSKLCLCYGIPFNAEMVSHFLGCPCLQSLTYHLSGRQELDRTQRKRNTNSVANALPSCY